MHNPITVLIVDHAAVQGARAILDTLPDIKVIGEAASGEEGVKLATQLVPDVVLMDLVMPGLDNVEATRQLKRASPRSQIVVLTSYYEDEYIYPAIRAGALSFVLKDIGPRDLADVVRKAGNGEVVLHPRVAACVIQELQSQCDKQANPIVELSERELEVLRCIAAGSSNVEIAEKLALSEKTVKGHVSNILSKLHLVGRTQAAVYTCREGILNRA